MKTREEFRQDMGPCSVCGQIAYSVYGGDAVRLKDGSVLCGNCLRKIRFLYPEGKPEMKKGMYVKNDPVSAVTAEEARDALLHATERLEAMREQFDFHHAVFRIDSAAVKKQGLLRAPENTFTGYVLYGRFNPGENVKLLHGNAAAEIILKEIEDLYSYGKGGEAGYACTL